MSCVVHRVPLQYLTNSAHWRDLVLAVGPGVLIPRPETECLINLALEVLACRQLCWPLCCTVALSSAVYFCDLAQAANAVQATAMQPALASGIWADLGTGSGALALGLATSQPEVKQA